MSENISPRPIIKTALCSFGMSGLIFHAPFLSAHPGFELYGVWERSKKDVKNIYAGVISFDSLEEMLADSAVELVIVNTPNYTHFDFAKKALLAGKHVLVEKAFTVTASEAGELIALAEQLNKKLAVFQNRRYDSDFKTVKKVVEAGVLGEIVEAEFHFDRFKPALSPKQHKETVLPGSGLLHDLGPHLADQAIHLFGMPTAVFGHTRITRPGSMVNDYFDIQLFYPSLVVRLKSSLIVKEIGPGFILHGRKGSFVKDRADIQEDILKAGETPGGENWGREAKEHEGGLNTGDENMNPKKIETEPGNYMEFFEMLYQAIAYDKAVPVSGEEGLRVMKVIDAVVASNNEKRVILIK